MTYCLASLRNPLRDLVLALSFCAIAAPAALADDVYFIGKRELEEARANITPPDEYSGTEFEEPYDTVEPTQVEYIRICDAYGSGYFYIPADDRSSRLRIGGCGKNRDELARLW
ncbi:MAG: porin, partial [Pseudomonadota bacterium]